MLEGSLPPGPTILAVERFPSMQALKEFYYSPEYQTAIQFRKDSINIHYIAALETITEAELEARNAAAAEAGG